MRKYSCVVDTWTCPLVQFSFILFVYVQTRIACKARRCRSRGLRRYKSHLAFTKISSTARLYAAQRGRRLVFLISIALGAFSFGVCDLQGEDYTKFVIDSPPFFAGVFFISSIKTPFFFYPSFFGGVCVCVFLGGRKAKGERRERGSVKIDWMDGCISTVNMMAKRDRATPVTATAPGINQHQQNSTAAGESGKLA